MAPTTAGLTEPILVVDTSVLLAAADRSAPEHEACATLLQEFAGTLVVPAPVVGDAFALMQARCGHEAAVAFLTEVTDGTLTVVDPDVDDYRRCLAVMDEFSHLSLGLVEASVIATAERLGTDRIASLNGRDFYAVRLAHASSVVLLPDGAARG